MFDYNAQLNLLMNLWLDLDVQTIVLLKLTDDFFVAFTHHQLYFVFVCIRSVAIPGDILDEVILRDVDRGTSQAQPDDEALGWDLLLTMIEVQVHEALDYKLFQFFVSSSWFIAELNLLFKLSNLLRP